MTGRTQGGDMTPLSITAELSSIDDIPCITVKVAAPQFEINVWIPLGEITRLKEVRATSWRSGSLRIGDVAGAPAWWSADTQADTLSILVGGDDQTWDVGATLPLSTLDAIIAEAASCQPPENGP